MLVALHSKVIMNYSAMLPYGRRQIFKNYKKKWRSVCKDLKFGTNVLETVYMQEKITPFMEIDSITAEWLSEEEGPGRIHFPLKLHGKTRCKACTRTSNLNTKELTVTILQFFTISTRPTDYLRGISDFYVHVFIFFLQFFENELPPI